MIPMTVMVTDVSGEEDGLTLESHGFQYHPRPYKCRKEVR
jgi:hypothetical protein